MHLGLMMECETRLGRSQEDGFVEAFNLAANAEEWGFDGVWLAERHFSSPERISGGAGGGVPSFASAPLILASALGARTSRVRIGIAVSVLPLSHPVRLAEEVATLDHICHGRLDFGIGRSGFATAYAGYGVSYAESRERFQETLDILLAAWTKPSFSYAGKHYQFEDVCLVPKPYQQPHPPLRIAATTVETFPTVGQAGYPIFVGLRGTDVPQTAAYVREYRAAWRASGHPGDGDVYLRIPVYVGADPDSALEEPRASTLSSYKRLAQSYANSATSQGAKMAEERAERGERLASADYDELLRNRLAYGTADQVAARLRDIGSEVGLSGFIIEPNVGGGIPRDLVFASVQRFARDVAPQLR